MKQNRTKRWTIAGVVSSLVLGFGAVPATAHHSFAMYDQTKMLVLTGVAYRFVGQANHAELYFYLIGPDGKLAKGADGKNVSWGVEMETAAMVAQQGITAATFPAGTIFSVKVNPNRDGRTFGSRVGGSAIAKCPWKTPPKAGSNCSTVAGSQNLGAAKF